LAFLHIELYRQRFGFLPSRIYGDKIYMCKETQVDERVGNPSHGKAVRKTAQGIENKGIPIPNGRGR
jgi:hypothetical protein